MSEGPDPADTGLFGKLPRSRPGTRSPRRAAGGETEAAKAKAESPRKATVSRKAPNQRPAPPPRVSEPAGSDPMPPHRDEAATSSRSDPSSADDQAAGLEELAWAGIAVTAEAATLGVRLMSRALDAARRATERG